MSSYNNFSHQPPQSVGGSSILKKALVVSGTALLGYFVGYRHGARTGFQYGMFARDMQMLGSVDIEAVEADIERNAFEDPEQLRVAKEMLEVAKKIQGRNPELRRNRPQGMTESRSDQMDIANTKEGSGEKDGTWDGEGWK